MKNLLLLFSITYCFIYSVQVNAQLSGLKTIGGVGANYATFTAAIAALHSQGVSGPVTFNVNPGNYVEKLTINAIVGASSTNVIIFQAVNSDSTSVIISDLSTVTSANNFVLKLISARFLEFKHISFVRTGFETYSQVIDISNSTRNTKFIGCRFIGNVAVNNYIYKSLVYSPNNYTQSYLEFSGNLFENGSFGLWLLGQGGTFQDNGTLITNNHFKNQFSTAIYLSYQESVQVTNNIIQTSSTNSTFYGIYAFYCDKSLRILKNKIGISSGVGIYIHNSIGYTNNIGLVANNFVGITTNNGGSGIFLNNSKTQNVYYNSVNLTGNSPTSSSLQVAGLSTEYLDLKNNIFSNSAGGYAVYVDPSTAVPISSSNFNNYYTTGSNFGYWKSTGNIASLSLWKTTTNLDLNSVSFNPFFVSATDLHAASGFLNGTGTSALNTPFVVDDIDGQIRNSPPDIGADEFDIDDLSVDSILFGKSYCLNFTDSLKIKIKNSGNFNFSGLISISYQINNLPIVNQNNLIVNLNPDSSRILTFASIVSLNQTGVFSIKASVFIPTDIKTSNDSLFYNQYFNVHSYPVVNLGTDTTTCSFNAITLNAGAGATNYLWSTGQNSPVIIVDSSGVGVGTKKIKVIVANNGCTTQDSIVIAFVDCTTIEDMVLDNKIKIFPNPSSGKINFVVSGPKVDLKFEVFDVSSLKIIEKKIENDQSNMIDLSFLPNGIYFLKISNNKLISTQKIIIH